MKAIRIFGRNIANALKSIFRNFSLSVASIVCTTITLVIVGIAIILSANIRETMHSVEGTFTIIAYVDSNATDDEISTVKSKLLEIKNIQSDEIVFKSKEDIRKERLESASKDSSLYNVLSSINENNNFLQSEFIVSVKELSKYSETVELIKTIDKVVKVQSNTEVADKLTPIFKTIEKIAIAIIIGLIAVTIFLICNTIKLTIYARKNEIEIMRLVGISNFVIKLPFTIEGLFLGIIGSIVPIITMIWGYTVVYDKLEGHFLLGNSSMLSPFPFTLYVSGLLLLIGALVGMIGSYTTVRRHLKI